MGNCITPNFQHKKERKTKMNETKTTLLQIISDSLIGKTIVRIDNDNSLNGHIILGCELVSYHSCPPLYGIEIITNLNKPGRVLPFDQCNSLVLR